MIIDTSNAHAAPGPSRGYARLRVAFQSLGLPAPAESPRLGLRRLQRLRPPKQRPGCAARASATVNVTPSPLTSDRSCVVRARLPVVKHMAARATWHVLRPTGVGYAPDVRGPAPELCPGTLRARQGRGAGLKKRPAPRRSTKASLPTTSDRTRQPAEFKHITKRGKRNEPGFPQ